MNGLDELTIPLPLAGNLDLGRSTGTRGTIEIIYYAGNLRAVSTNQDWFWTEEWQAGERKVDEYIKLGKYQEFDSMEEFLRTLGD
jgi:antitoxin PrlF